MKPENTLITSSPAGILNSEKELGAESEVRLPLPLPGSQQQMTFTINGEDFTFTITVDSQGNLLDFTATGEGATFDCMIQLVSDVDGARFCCGPSGCTSGSCL